MGASPDHEKEIKRWTRVEWSAFGRHQNVMKSNLPLLLK